MCARRIIRATICLLVIPFTSIVAAQEKDSELNARVRGMLLGSLLGDAAGGPVEFKPADQLRAWLPDLRSWSPERFQAALVSGELARTFELLPYAGIRDDVAPYGPWEESALAGTVTDDTRHKIILMNCLRDHLQRDSAPILTQRSLAAAYIQFVQTPPIQTRPDYVKLGTESLQEYVGVGRWILGNRDLSNALPPQRLWAGIATCSGQMTLPPLAAVYAGDPDQAYRAAFSLGFVDVGLAKDINAALVAALSAGLADHSDSVHDRWSSVLSAVRETDPYRYEAVPFAKRPATEWLAFAINAAERAAGSPKELFRILEHEGRAKYYWDAHFTFASALAFLKFCNFQPLEAITVSLVFGHDTDSAAQVIGALAGAVHGAEVFPAKALRQVEDRLAADYHQTVEEWVSVLSQLRNRGRSEAIIEFVEHSP